MVVSKYNLNMFLMIALTAFSSLHVWVLFEIGIVFTGTELSLFFASLLIILNFKSRISKSFLGFIFLYLLLQFININSILFSDDVDRIDAGIRQVIKNTVYLVLPVGIYFGMKHSNNILSKRLFVVFLLIFAIAAFFYGSQRSVDFVLFIKFFLGGNFSEVQYGVFHRLFEDYRLIRHEDASASGFRHGVLYLLLCTFLLSKFYTITEKKTFKLDYRDFIIIFLNILFLSRQVLVCTFVYYLLIVFFYQKNIYFRLAFILSMFAGLALVFAGVSLGVNENVYEKLVYDVFNNPRLVDFGIAFNIFREHVFTGVGYGSALPAGSFAHNLVVNQLHQSGIFGGFVAFLLVGYLVIIGYRSVLLFMRSHSNIYVILACLVSIPILKMMVGVGGDLDFASWFALGVMFFIKERAEGWQLVKENI